MIYLQRGFLPVKRKAAELDQHTIHDAYENICQGITPWVALGNFMNMFFGSFPLLREDLLQTSIEIPENPSQELQQWATFCAASVEYLSQKYHLHCPTWVYHPCFVPLSEPWFHYPLAISDRIVREQLIQETPIEFARKNIFCGNRVYANKYEAAANLRDRTSFIDKPPQELTS